MTRKKPKFEKSERNAELVIVYGACTKIGVMASKIFLNNGYRLLLIDTNLSSLQKLQKELELVYPIKVSNEEVIEEHKVGERIHILQFEFAQQRDSTQLERKIHKILINATEDVELNIRNVLAFVNCMDFINESNTLSDKYFHELLFDQIQNYTCNQIVGFTTIYNYFTRIAVNKDKPSYVLNFKHKRIYPWQQSKNHILMRFMKRFYFPLTFNSLNYKINLCSHATKDYVSKIIQESSVSYPLIKPYEFELDGRELKIITIKQVEKMIMSV